MWNWIRLIGWLVIGLVVYFTYSQKHSRVQALGCGKNAGRVIIEVDGVGPSARRGGPFCFKFAQSPVMKIVTAAEMRSIDRATSERFGVPSLTLMENAGAAVAQHVLADHATAQRIVVFCGKGNNGGDGFVAARLLHEAGKTVQVILLADPDDLRGDAAVMLRKLPVAPLVVRSSGELKSDRVRFTLPADLYLDAILGTGFKPPVKGLYADAIEILNASSAACDCGRYSVRCRRRRDEPAERNDRARGFDRYLHRGSSSACFQLAHRTARLMLPESDRRTRRSSRRST